jgi:hypothetical protein
MSSLFVALFALVASSFRTRAALQAEILALRHQLAVCQKNAPRRLRLHRCDRLLWVLLYRFWSGWRRCLEIVHPDTVLRWHCRAFAWHWTRKSRHLPGRPEVAANIRNLIQRMSQANAGRDTNSISCGKGRFPPIGPYLRFMSDHAHVLSSLSLSRQPLSFSKLSPFYASRFDRGLVRLLVSGPHQCHSYRPISVRFRHAPSGPCDGRKCSLVGEGN